MLNNSDDSRAIDPVISPSERLNMPAQTLYTIKVVLLETFRESMNWLISSQIVKKPVLAPRAQQRHHHLYSS